jgi:hypothetical protein
MPTSCLFEVGIDNTRLLTSKRISKLTWRGRDHRLKSPCVMASHPVGPGGPGHVWGGGRKHPPPPCKTPPRASKTVAINRIHESVSRNCHQAPTPPIPNLCNDPSIAAARGSVPTPPILNLHNDPAVNAAWMLLDPEMEDLVNSHQDPNFAAAQRLFDAVMEDPVMEDQNFPRDSTMVTASALTAIWRSLDPVMEDEDVFLSSDDEYSSDGGGGSWAQWKQWIMLMTMMMA